MKHKRIWMLCILMAVMIVLSTTAFAIDETEVESAIAASSQEEVAGNVFIWFLCAIAFLKISQKIDSFMSSLGINVGRTGGSMLGELMIAGKAIGAAAKATGGAIGGVFNRNHSSSSTTNRAAGQGFTGGGNGLVGVAHRVAGNAAASSATGRGSGLGSVVGGAMFGSSLKSGGKFATDVVGAVATGNISAMGSITGNQASEALTSYLGYSSGQGTASDSAEHGTDTSPSGFEPDFSSGGIPGKLSTPMAEPAEDHIISGKSLHRSRGGSAKAPDQKQFHLLIDIQAKMAEGKTVGYEKWAKKFNRKEAARTVILLKEKGLDNYDDLVAQTEKLSARFDELSDSIKAAEKRIVEVQALLKHMDNYYDTREIYVEYRKSGYSGDRVTYFSFVCPPSWQERELSACKYRVAPDTAMKATGTMILLPSHSPFSLSGNGEHAMGAAR